MFQDWIKILDPKTYQESQRLVNYAKQKHYVVIGLLQCDPFETKKANYIKFLEREMMAPDFFSYENSKFLFTQNEITSLHWYLLETYSHVLAHLDFVAKGHIYASIVEHLCFMFYNDDTIQNLVCGSSGCTRYVFKFRTITLL